SSGRATGPNSIVTPLQPGAGGAPVLNGYGTLVGLVGPIPQDSRTVAGILPARNGAVVTASSLKEAISILATMPRAPAAQPLRAAGTVSAIGEAVVPILCVSSSPLIPPHPAPGLRARIPGPGGRRAAGKVRRGGRDPHGSLPPRFAHRRRRGCGRARARW